MQKGCGPKDFLTLRAAVRGHRDFFPLALRMLVRVATTAMFQMPFSSFLAGTKCGARVAASAPPRGKVPAGVGGLPTRGPVVEVRLSAEGSSSKSV